VQYTADLPIHNSVDTVAAALGGHRLIVGIWRSLKLLVDASYEAGRELVGLLL
jgi:hypothetical protein